MTSTAQICTQMAPNHFGHRVASSVYSLSACDAIDRVLKPLADISGGWSREYSRTHAVERRETLQKFSEKGKILCSDGGIRVPDSEGGNERTRPYKLAPEDSHTAASTSPKLQRKTIVDFESKHQPRVENSRSKTPMRVLTRHGTVLCANKVYDNEHSGKIAPGRSSDLSRPVYNPIPVSSSLEDRLAKNFTKDQGTQTACHDGLDDMPIDVQEVRVQQLFDEPIAPSRTRYVYLDSKPLPAVPTRRPSLVRKLSDAAKQIFRRPSQTNKRQISNPTNFRDLGPKHSRRISHPETKATTTSNQLAGSSGSMRAELPFRKFERQNGPEHDRSRSDESQLQRTHSGKHLRMKSAFTPSQTERDPTREIRGAGDPSRNTRFTDFITASETPRNRSEVSQDQYSQPELVPEQLHVPNVPHTVLPPREESRRKRVDTSRKSWMPPEPNTVRKPDIHQLPDRPMGESDPVEEIIDVYADWSPRVPPSATFSQAFSDPFDLDDEEAELEIVLDTWDRGSHTSWVRTERPESQILSSDYQRVGGDLYAHWMDRDEGLMEKLPYTWAGDEDMYGYI